MTFDEFKETVNYVTILDKDFTVELTSEYSFYYGTHSSMFGSHRGFWIRKNKNAIYPKGVNVMDSFSYDMQQFYDFMVEKDLFIDDFHYKIDNAIIRNV